MTKYDYLICYALSFLTILAAIPDLNDVLFLSACVFVCTGMILQKMNEIK